jgi:hypothetical protein
VKGTIFLWSGDLSDALCLIMRSIPIRTYGKHYCVCVWDSLRRNQRVNQTQKGRFRTILSRSWPEGWGLRQHMKKDITEYIARCMECQKVKAEHRHLAGLLQPLPIPEWKWEVVTMDFIIGLPRIGNLHDSIMVVVDKLVGKFSEQTVNACH